MSKAAKTAEVADLETTSIEAEEAPIEGRREISETELRSITEALIFVAEEPISAKFIADVIDVERETNEKAIDNLAQEYDLRGGELQFREIAGDWHIATRPEHHEDIRAYLSSKPRAKL